MTVLVGSTIELTAVAEHLKGLPGVRQSERSQLLRWTVRGRLVARQLDRTAIVIRSEIAARERLIAKHPRTFTVRPRFEAHMMVVAELETASAAAVFKALDAAWALQTGGG